MPQTQSLSPAPASSGVIVNDIHSALNATRVRESIAADSLDALQAAIRRAQAENCAISIAGGRHAMGAQQFGTDTLHLDLRALNRVLDFDAAAGTIEVEAGIQWPALIDYLLAEQGDTAEQWGIIQKQTGADRLSIGGAVSANVHGRGLAFPPLIHDVASLQLIDAQGNLQTCSRTENAALFRLAVGGYGLFGVIYAVKLRLARRQKVTRHVEIITADHAIAALEKRRDAGYLYGDFQFAIDEASPDFLYRGLLAAYQPVPADTPLDTNSKELRDEDWMQLTLLSHTDKAQAYALYTGHYLGTHGQVYWSDTHQLSAYFDDYHARVDQALGATVPGSEMISELYVPRAALATFLSQAAADLRHRQASVIYGTVRLIEPDTESFLAWAKTDYACIVLNLHVDHSPAGIEQSAAAFRSLIDIALALGGSFFLTYHKWATQAQVAAAYPEFAAFLAHKRHYDPDERFQSDWYRHYRRLFHTDAHTDAHTGTQSKSS